MQQAAPCALSLPLPRCLPVLIYAVRQKYVENFHAHTHNKHTHTACHVNIWSIRKGERETEVDSGHSWQWAQLTTVAHFRLALCNDLPKVQVECHAQLLPHPLSATCASAASSSTEISLDTLLTMRGTHSHKFGCGNFCTQFTVDCHKSQHGWASSRLLLHILLLPVLLLVSQCCRLFLDKIFFLRSIFTSLRETFYLWRCLRKKRSLKVAQNNYRYI